MTQCVVVLGLLCVEMCLVWSWFGLFFDFLFFWTCTSVFTAVCYRWSACLFNFELLFWDFLFCNVKSFSTKKKNAQKHKKNPHLTSPLPLPPLTPSLSPSHTHPNTHNHAQKKPHLLPHPTAPTLCLAVAVSPQLLTDFLVFLQSRKASEQAKSVDSKTDSIGSGRAIPIKQVSSFIDYWFRFFFSTYIFS